MFSVLKSARVLRSQTAKGSSCPAPCCPLLFRALSFAHTRVSHAPVTAVGLRFHLWSCDVPNLKLTIKENFCRTALHVMLRAEAKAQVEP